jgi:hypothetical protein
LRFFRSSSETVRIVRKFPWTQPKTNTARSDAPCFRFPALKQTHRICAEVCTPKNNSHPWGANIKTPYATYGKPRKIREAPGQPLLKTLILRLGFRDDIGPQ